MNEPVLCDAAKKQNLSGGEALAWEDLSAIKATPFQHADNMTLSSSHDATVELKKAQHFFNTVLDTTPVAMGRCPEKVKALSERLGKHIIQGTTPMDISTELTSVGDEVEASKEDIARMEQELIYGVESDDGSHVMRAGFIGELQISDPISMSEIRQLKACAVVQNTTKAPLLVAVPPSQMSTVIDILNACSAVLSRTVFTHIDYYCKDRFSVVKDTLDRGINVCLDRYSVSPAIWDLDHEFPSLEDVATTCATLLQINPSYCQNLLLSSGVHMKLQYTKYGGVGYRVLCDFLIPKLLQKGVSQVQIDMMLRSNPTQLLSWWTPPPPKEKQKEYIPCSVCKRLFEPILGEYYTKYTFTYCDTACLRKHRKMGFKSLE